MIPVSHIMILALLQFSIGLLGLLLRRAGMVVLVSVVIMLNGVLLFFCAPSAGGRGSQMVGVELLALIVAVALTGAAVLYAFHRFRKTVSVDEHDRMKH
jgi:NADH:ubiquinone oxidoreductase subunit K